MKYIIFICLITIFHTSDESVRFTIEKNNIIILNEVIENVDSIPIQNILIKQNNSKLKFSITGCSYENIENICLFFKKTSNQTIDLEINSRDFSYGMYPWFIKIDKKNLLKHLKLKENYTLYFKYKYRNEKYSKDMQLTKLSLE